MSAPAFEAFMKTLAGASPADFEAEAAGLRWLGEAGAPVPRILGVNDQPASLTLERIGPGTLSRDGAEQLGRELASVHRAGAPAHGALPPGSPDEALKDRPGAPDAERARDWAELYAEDLVLPLVAGRATAGPLRAGRCGDRAACARLVDWRARRSRPPLTGTCGAATPRGTPRGGAGSSTPRRTAGTARSTWRC